jgi:hypothetical protein
MRMYPPAESNHRAGRLNRAQPARPSSLALRFPSPYPFEVGSMSRGDLNTWLLSVHCLPPWYFHYSNGPLSHPSFHRPPSTTFIYPLRHSCSPFGLLTFTTFLSFDGDQTTTRRRVAKVTASVSSVPSISWRSMALTASSFFSVE